MDVTLHNPLSFLTKGSQVEVSSDEDGLSGVWFVATVIQTPPSISDSARNNLVYVEYHNLLADDGSSRKLREYAKVSYVRPSPPPDSDTNNSYFSDFKLNDVVDAFYRDGWWTGVVTSVLDKHNFVVTFENPPDKLQCHISKLRIHRKWVDGKWVQPQNQRTAGLMFTVGNKVEVSFESSTHIWFPATILKKHGNDTFQVEYQKPGNGDEALLHKVTVDYLHIRPSPPHLRDKSFVVSEKVDAYYDFGWWSGVITKELADSRYVVLFEHTKEEKEFIYSRIRPHIEWKRGKWFNTVQGDTDGRTNRSSIDTQIVQTPPSISKQSTVATSIMNRTQSTDFDSDDERSQPSKRSNDLTMTDGDPGKRQSGTSDDQTEGFNSEASVKNDQAGKTENLSNGKKARSKRGPGIELDTPLVYPSRKKWRLTKELKSLQSCGEGPKLDSSKTRTQVIKEKRDAIKDVTRSQSNGMTVSQGKTLQKSPIEIPDVAEDDTIQPLTAVDKTRTEGDAASVVPTRKRGRPPRLQNLSPETPVTVNSENGGVFTSSGSKLSDDNQILSSTNDQLQLSTENSEPELIRHLFNKKSSTKGKRGKRRTISSINTESPVIVYGVDYRDASNEKADENLNNFTKQNLEPSLEKSLDTVSDDQRLSRFVKEVQPHGPDGSREQSSKESEKRTEAVACSDGEQTLPFVKSSHLWQKVESTEAFQTIPQRPHFRRILEGVIERARESMAFGMMLMFSSAVDKTRELKFDSPRSEIEECLETLAELEDNGFDVILIRERLIRLLGEDDKQDELKQQSKRSKEKITEYHRMVHEENVDGEMEEISRKMRELDERRRQLKLKKEKQKLEFDVMKTNDEKIERELKQVQEGFNRLAASPF